MGTILDLEFGNQKFDTIVANGALTGEDSEIVLIMEKLKSLLKPGGVMFFVGHEPPPEKVDGPEKIHNEILQVIESAKRVSRLDSFSSLPIIHK
jgi:2-polyprenyl-3-methyl-5-hydroxy-6-metoxy-1,4-benzoquinol methylase